MFHFVGFWSQEPQIAGLTGYGTDEWRVGMEAYTAGRVSVNWMKLVPFLQNCGVDVAAGRASKCKVTAHAFSKVCD